MEQNDIDILADDMSTKNRYMEHTASEPAAISDGTGNPADNMN
jgi:hypothetical protein